jgi:hypothetical protein
LGKLVIKASETNAAKYMVQLRRAPSQTRLAFLNNHVKDLGPADFFVVSTNYVSTAVCLRHPNPKTVVGSPTQPNQCPTSPPATVLVKAAEQGYRPSRHSYPFGISRIECNRPLEGSICSSPIAVDLLLKL